MVDAALTVLDPIVLVPSTTLGARVWAATVEGATVVPGIVVVIVAT